LIGLTVAAIDMTFGILALSIYWTHAAASRLKHIMTIIYSIVVWYINLTKNLISLAAFSTGPTI